MNRTVLYILIGIIIVFLLWLFYTNTATAPVSVDVNQQPTVSTAPVSPTAVPTMTPAVSATQTPSPTGGSPTSAMTPTPTTPLTPSPTQ